MTHFTSFFFALYASESTARPAEPITLRELERALKCSSKAKSPGLDGIPKEFYSTFWTELGPLILDIINFSVRIGHFRQTVNTAVVSLVSWNQFVVYTGVWCYSLSMRFLAWNVSLRTKGYPTWLRPWTSWSLLSFGPWWANQMDPFQFVYQLSIVHSVLKYI